jgi:hypothetical protein
LCMAAVGADGVVDELEFSDEGAELGLEGIVGTVCCVVVVGRPGVGLHMYVDLHVPVEVRT